MTAIAETGTRTSETPSFIGKRTEDGIRYDLGVLTADSPLEDRKRLTELIWGISPTKRVVIVFRDWDQNALQELLQSKLGTRYRDFITLVPLDSQELTQEFLDETLAMQMSSSPSR